LELEGAVVVEQPDTSSSLRDKEKVWEPSAHAAFAKAAAPIRLMLIGPAERILMGSGTDSETSGMVSDGRGHGRNGSQSGIRTDMECYMSVNPVNQWIMLVEPVKF